MILLKNLKQLTIFVVGVIQYLIIKYQEVKYYQADYPKEKNPVGQIFRIAASPLARDKGEMGNYYRRMKAKSAGLQANVATAHKIARIFFTIIKKKVEYDPQKVGVDEKKLIKIKMDRLEKALDKLNRKYSEAS